MAERIYWMRETPDLFCASVVSTWGVRRYLVVEVMPGGGWDWAAWASDGAASQQGSASTEGEAMLAAEDGARRLLEPRREFSSPPRLHLAYAAPMSR